MALGKAAICCNEPLKHWHDQFNRYDTRLSRICEKVPIRKSGTAGRVRAGLPFRPIDTAFGRIRRFQTSRVWPSQAPRAGIAVRR